jgi:CBS domain-containing protein
MTPDPATVSATETVATASHLMAERRLKRLPVVDADGLLVGILSRSDVLRAVGETFPKDAEDREEHPGALTVGDLMRTDTPKVRADADLAALLDAVVSTRLNRAVVVDENEHVLGVINDADLVRSVDPSAESGILAALMRTAGRPAGSKLRARDLLSRPPVTVHADATIAQAAVLMTERPRKLLCVTDETGRLIGILDRADLLRAAGDALRDLPPPSGHDDDDDDD